MENVALSDKQLSGWLRLLLDMGPLLVFFAGNGIWGIYGATAAFMVATILAGGVSWHLTRKLSAALLVTAAVVVVFGGLTLWLADETFIKMKPTIVQSIFAAILLAGLLQGRSYLKVVMESALPNMPDAAWRTLTLRWALFFLVMAGLNEALWRNLTTDQWVTVKTFGYLPVTFLFTLTQMPLILRYAEKDENNDGV